MNDWKCDVTCSWPHSLSQTVTPSWTSSLSSVTYCMDDPFTFLLFSCSGSTSYPTSCSTSSCNSFSVSCNLVLPLLPFFVYSFLWFFFFFAFADLLWKKIYQFMTLAKFQQKQQTVIFPKSDYMHSEHSLRLLRTACSRPVECVWTVYIMFHRP